MRSEEEKLGGIYLWEEDDNEDEDAEAEVGEDGEEVNEE